MLKGFIPAVLSLTVLASPAFAAKAGRHCVDKDKNEISLTASPGSQSARSARRRAEQC